MRDHDRLIERAKKKAAQTIENAEREVAVRVRLHEDFPQIPPPAQVYFHGAWGGHAPQVWLKYAFPRPLDHNEALTPGGYWREARRILDAFDWETGVVVKRGCTHLGPEDGTNYDDEKEEVSVFEGPVLHLEGGRGYGPTVSLSAWTKISGEGFFRVRVELQGPGQFPLSPLPSYRSEKDHLGRVLRRYWDLPQIPEALQVFKWWSSEDAYHRTYLLGYSWDAWADQQQARLDG